MSEINLLREAMTVISFAVFIGIVVFAIHPRNRVRVERAAQLPPDESGR